MAARLKICELLCFLSSKYGKLDNRKLIYVIHSFYNVEHINEAKEILSSEVDNLKLTMKWPKPSRRRESDLSARALKEVQDILTLWAFLDENQLFSELSTFLVRDVSLIPTARLEDGDMSLLLNKLDKIQSANDDIRQTINNLVSSNAQFSICPTTNSSIPVFGDLYSDKVRKMNSKDICDLSQQRPVNKPLTDLIRSSQFDHSSTSGASDVEDSQGYETVRRRTRNSKRFRGEAGIEVGESPSYRAIVPNKSNMNRKQKLFGSSTADLGLKAAKTLIKKKHYYVGNLDVECTVETLKSFLSAMGVAVIKCDSIKSSFKNTASFFVGIEARTLDVFLEMSNWPMHVVIREWAFKSKQSGTNNTKSVEAGRDIATVDPNASYVPNDDMVFHTEHGVEQQ